METVEFKLKSIENLNINNCNDYLPDDSNELSKLEHDINSVKSKIEELIKNNRIDHTSHNYYYDEVAIILDSIGQLSLPALILTDNLYDIYNLKFCKTPKIGLLLYQKQSESINKKYTILKNRCHRLLDVLDLAFIAKYNNIKITPQIEYMFVEQNKLPNIPNIILPKNWKV